MEINGTQIIPAPRARVWDALNDPAVLKLCLPGCESVERTAADLFQVVVATSIGPLRARFTGTLRMTDADAPKSCVMVFEGQGGAVGFGKGSTNVTLNETADGTELTYSAQAQVGGKLAQVGSRLIDNVAKKMSDDFFKAFRRQLAPDAGETASASGAAASGSGSGAASRVRASVPSAPSASSHAMEARPAAAGHVAGGGPVMVPGWWLGVAALLGIFATWVGAHWMR